MVAGSVVGVSFDPMLAKVIAHASTRADAAGRLALALERLHLGGVTTNRDFLVSTLRHRGFLDGDTTTDFIERHRPAPPTIEHAELQRLAAAAALWLQAGNRARAGVLGDLPSGWRNARLPAQHIALAHGDDRIDVSYRSRRDGAFVIVGDDGSDTVAVVHRCTPDTIDVEIGGRRRIHRITRAGERLHIQSRATTVTFTIVPRFELPGAADVGGGLTAPMPGVVLDVRVERGERVEPGQTLVVLEAMKMEHHMKAAAPGVVAEVRVAAGQRVDTGDALLLIDDDEIGESDGAAGPA